LTAQVQTQFEWCDASGNVRSLPDLKGILRKHRQWIESGEKAGTRANLAGANLDGAFLVGANLTKANLTDANLSRAKLINEAVGKVFCLCHAPSAEAATQVHREAHGLVPFNIIEVEPRVADLFLGGSTHPDVYDVLAFQRKASSPRPGMGIPSTCSSRTKTARPLAS
jgi:hypothetical protein